MRFEFLFIHTVLVSLLGADLNPAKFRSCFEELGCLDVNDSWYDKTLRPYNLEPLDRHIINTDFILIKCTEKKNDLVYDEVTAKKESLDSSGFNENGGVSFLIHDFTSNGYTGWIKHMVYVVPNKNQINMISVDWEAGAEPPFKQAVANARVVALEIVHFIQVLQDEYKITPYDIYLIGHGVGAHIAGYVGKCVPGIRKITALDPTGPYFAGMPNMVKLTLSDAKYVEVLHTDACDTASQGTVDPMGHADFYINNACRQPGCNHTSPRKSITTIDRDFLKEGVIFPACSHKRSFKYFIESVGSTDGCQFLSIRCKNYEDFINAKCSTCESKTPNETVCATFGFHTANYTTDSPNKYFVNVRGDPPYCMHPYRVNITIATDSKSQTGHFEIIMVDELDKITNASATPSKLRNEKFVAGNSYLYLFYASPPKLLKIKEAKVKWTMDSLCLIFCHKTIRVEMISITSISIGMSTPENNLYPEDQIGLIESGSYINFQPSPTETESKRHLS